MKANSLKYNPKCTAIQEKFWLVVCSMANRDLLPGQC